jgi:hypothetical protein
MRILFSVLAGRDEWFFGRGLLVIVIVTPRVYNFLAAAWARKAAFAD